MDSERFIILYGLTTLIVLPILIGFGGVYLFGIPFEDLSTILINLFILTIAGYVFILFISLSDHV